MPYKAAGTVLSMHPAVGTLQGETLTGETNNITSACEENPDETARHVVQ